MILTLFIVATVTFFLMKLMPGSPYANQEKLTAQQIQIMNVQYGLNKPIFQQYLIYYWVSLMVISGCHSSTATNRWRV